MIAVVLAGCATVEENPKKNAQLGLITTPPTYYTTQRARYLGEKYKNKLDRLVERIVRNPKTANPVCQQYCVRGWNRILYSLSDQFS